MKDKSVNLYLFLRMTRVLLSYLALNKHIINTFTCFFPSYIRSEKDKFRRWPCFSFYWLGKLEFSTFTNVILQVYVSYLRYFVLLLPSIALPNFHGNLKESDTMASIFSYVLYNIIINNHWWYFWLNRL